MRQISISTSKIRAMECPYYFKHDYSQRDPERDATTPLPLLTGRLAHRIIDQYDRALIAKGVTSDSEIFDEVFKREWEAQSYIPDSEHDDMRDYLMRFAESHVLDLEHILGTEVKLALSWEELEPVDYDSDEAWLRVILDRVEYYPSERLAVITDYKTQRYMPSEAQQKRNLQTSVYPFSLFMSNPNIDYIKMVFHFIRYNWFQEFEFVRSDVANIEDKLKSFTERLAAKLEDPEAEWEPITGANCPICRVQECPLESMGIQPIKSKEDATRVAMQIEALKTKAKRLDADLKAYTKVTDESITTNLGTYAWHPSKTIRGLKASSIAQIALDEGIDLDLVLAPDRKKIDKLEPEIRDKILGLGKVSITTRYRLVKSVRDDEEGE
jgi:hypothetical protein